MAISEPPGNGPRQGNHRTGRSKGERNRAGQKPWRSDSAVMERVLLVSDPALSEQPIPVIHRAVNLHLKRNNKRPVTERTIRNDLQRALELYQEKIAAGGEATAALRMRQFHMLWVKVWRALARTPEGPLQAPLIATGIRLVEDMAKLDGSWGRGGDMLGQVEQHNYGPAPYERVQTGELSEKDYRGWLAVVALQQEHQPALGPAPGHDADSGDQDVSVDEAWAPAPTQEARAGDLQRPSRPPPGMPQPGRVPEPKIVDWHPDDEDFE